MADKLLVDCETGDATSVPLTSDEVAERDAALVTEQQRTDRETVERASLATIEQRLDAALDQLRTFVNSPKPATAAAQASAAYDAVKLVARVVIWVVRLVRRRLDGVD